TRLARVIAVELPGAILHQPRRPACDCRPTVIGRLPRARRAPQPVRHIKCKATGDRLPLRGGRVDPDDRYSASEVVDITLYRCRIRASRAVPAICCLDVKPP